MEPRYALTAPVAVADQYFMHEADELNPTPTLVVGGPGVLANDSDAENSLTALLVNNVHNGGLTLNSDGGFNYQPLPGWDSDFFSYAAYDGNTPINNCYNAETDTDCIATATISIGNSNPVAEFDAFTVIKNTSAILDVLANDTDNENDDLDIVEINNSPVVIGTPVDLTNGSLTLNSDYTLSFTPAAGFEGTVFFSYKASDGVRYGGISSDGTVAITVAPRADAGEDQFLFEGDSLELEGSGIGPGLEYTWYIDTIAGDHEPAVEQAILTGASHTLTWEQLEEFGITNATNAFITLRVEDDNDVVSYDQVALEIGNVNPSFLSMTVNLVSGECGTSTVLTAQFYEPNSHESDFDISVDWLADPESPLDDNVIVTPNGGGLYTVTANVPTGTISPVLHISGYGEETSDSPQNIPLDFSTGLNTVRVGSAGTSFDLVSPLVMEGLTYSWSVSKDGSLPVDQAVSLSSFTFTPTLPGSYTVTLTINFGGGSTVPVPFAVLVPGGGSGGITSADITGNFTDRTEGTSITLGSDFEGGCGGTPVYAWSVLKDGSSTPLVGSGDSFSFTPIDEGSYEVYLTVDGVPADPQTITVTNVVPSVAAIISQAVAGSPEASVLVTGFSDPGSADVITLNIEWESGITDNIVLQTSSLPYTATHTYSSTGAKPVSVTVSDGDGGESNAVSASFTVLAAENNGSLEVMGTGGSDTIELSSGSVIVTINNVQVGVFEVTGGVSVAGGGGDDTIVVEVSPAGGVNIDGEGGSDSVVIDGNGNLAGTVAISDSGASGTNSVQVLGTPGNDTIEQTAGGFVLNGITISLDSSLDEATVEGGAGSDEIVVSGVPPVPVEVQAVSDMVIIGTAGNDQIQFKAGSQAGVVVGKLNGVVVSQFSPTGNLVARGGSGDDEIQVSNNVALAAWLFGGDGKDRLKGSSGDDVLVGDAGDDVLSGGAGRDVLVGGDGRDVILGNAEDDILIAGILFFGDNLDAALVNIQDAWTSGSSFIARTANIEGWGENPLAPEHRLNSTTVLDDNAKDNLSGDQGVDWFFANLWLDQGDDAEQKDKIVDINLFELLFANELDFSDE